MTLIEVRTKIAAMPLKELESVCARAGVPYGTALKIRGGYVDNPRVKTIEALAKALKDTPAELQQAAE